MPLTVNDTEGLIKVKHRWCRFNGFANHLRLWCNKRICCLFSRISDEVALGVSILQRTTVTEYN